MRGPKVSLRAGPTPGGRSGMVRGSERSGAQRCDKGGGVAPSENYFSGLQRSPCKLWSVLELTMWVYFLCI